MFKSLKATWLLTFVLIVGFLVSDFKAAPEVFAAQENNFKQMLEILKAKNKRLEVISGGTNVVPARAKIGYVGDDYVRVDRKGETTGQPDFTYYIPFSGINRIEEVSSTVSPHTEIVKIILR